MPLGCLKTNVFLTLPNEKHINGIYRSYTGTHKSIGIHVSQKSIILLYLLPSLYCTKHNEIF